MDRLVHYTRIPTEYVKYLGGLRWSADGEAVEWTGDGRTVAFAAEIALFMEGFLSKRRLIHFGFILHLMGLLGHGARSRPNRSVIFANTFHKTGRPLRNAGVFCAVLCKNLPAVADPIDIDLRSYVTSSPLLPILCGMSESGKLSVPEEPPLAPATFENIVLHALGQFLPDEIEHWLRHGRGPLDEAGEELTINLEVAKPPSLEGLLEELAKRQRLARAMPFVSQLVSALSLPPRKQAPDELPMGGYSDVVTRGQPELILPSQFAMDDLEFVRRFAANELLYFRREEPHHPLREELVILLDQGVRTWGDVRLVLSAAVFALIKRAARKELPLRLAATSSDGRTIDVREATEPVVGALLEASDLSAQPGAALERVLEEPAEQPRDIVLLSHPRNLAEPDVSAAACRLPVGTRLFALTVDEHGQAQLDQIKHGVAVPVCQFAIDWSRGQDAVVPEPVRVSPDGWKGDVEPIGFPFRFGTGQKVEHFGFDGSGERLLLASGNGMLHLFRHDGAELEVLPRPFYRGQVMTDVHAILGVTGGFAVCGTIGIELMAAHYDLAHWTCTLRILGMDEGGTHNWCYFSKYHSIAVRALKSCYAVDLGSGDRACGSEEGDRRVQKASVAAWWENYGWGCMRTWSESNKRYLDQVHGKEAMAVFLNPKTGEIAVAEQGKPLQVFTPLADGLPELKDAEPAFWRISGHTLALHVNKKSPTVDIDALSLVVTRFPEGRVLADVTNSLHALSPDGRRLARLVGNNRLLVHDFEGGGGPYWLNAAGRYHHDVEVELGDGWMTLCVGEWTHLIRWDGERLVHRHAHGGREEFLKQEFTGKRRHRPGLKPSFHAGPQNLVYDFKRFVKYLCTQSIAPSDLNVLVDIFGQVCVFHSTTNTLLCMLFVFRDKFAAWMPDGTCYGPEAITGRPASANALEKLARALRKEK